MQHWTYAPSPGRTRLGVVALGLWVVVLVASAAASGERSTVIGAFMGIAGAAAGLAAVATGMRKEMSDEAETAPVGRAIAAAVATTGPAWVLFAVLFGALYFGTHSGRALGIALAVVAGISLVAPIIYGVRAGFHVDGVDREIQLRSTSLSFFVTVLSAGVYALFEGISGAPHLSMWVVWTVGLGTWAVSSTVMRHRLSR